MKFHGIVQAFIVVLMWIYPDIVYCDNAFVPALNKNCPIIEMVDELNNLKIFPSQSASSSSVDTFKTQPDLVYEYYVAAIGKKSPIDFDYNSYVRKYIDIYTNERREQVAQMLGLAEFYFPLFDDYLDKYQLPLELKYLAVVESALNPRAISKSGAVGLWQFKINTGRMFNLNINSYVDERMDPEKSTDAACQYLQYLYRTFNNWQLAIAAYNVGPGAIKNVIARNGGETNFWKLYDQFPESAQNYVPAFIAAAYIMQNYNKHKISPVTPIVLFSQTDTVRITKPINFNEIASTIDIPIDIIRFLNPTYKLDYIPESVEPQTLRLPSEKVASFIKNENTISANSRKNNNYQNTLADSSATKQKITYVVKSGDSMHKIAITYGCTIDDIQNWNPSIDSTLTIGQNITIWISKKQWGKFNHQN